MTTARKHMARCASVALLLSATACLAGESDVARPAQALRAKVSSAAKQLKVLEGAVPGAVFAEGGEAVPLAFGRSDGTECSVAAASVMGRGRVVAFGHELFFAGEAGEFNAAFTRECLAWLAGGKMPRKLYVDFMARGLAEPLAKVAGGVETEILPRYAALQKLPEGAVFVAYPDSHPLAEAAQLAAFVKRGGGVLSFVVGWGWHQVSGGRPFSTDNPFNAAMGECGLFTCDNAVEPYEGGFYSVADAAGLQGTIGEEAFDLVLGGRVSPAVSARCQLVLGGLMRAMPADDKRLMSRLLELADAANPGLLPSPEHPLRSFRVKERIGLILHARRWQADPERNWPAHPAAAVYPGLPSASGPRVTRAIEVDLSVPRWHGTGLFAAAGEPLTVTIPDDAKKLGLKVRVGTSTCCNTGHKVWMRAPEVSVELPLDKTTTTFSSPFGGMVYIDVPSRASNGGKIKVMVGSACPAPWYVEGRDTVESWKKALESSPSPIAEIENDVIALTVPADFARKASDPQELLSLWRQILENDARLTGIPAKRPCPERMCFDAQICAGYMHSGYPIMIPKHCMTHLLDIETMRTAKVDDVWGFFHEMGHNHQNPDWTFNGTGEVTVNFFTLYNMEKICGKKPWETDKLKDPSLRARVAKWKKNGRSFDEWKSDPFLALVFFVELQQKYGWEAFEKLFAEYRTLPGPEHPQNDFEKRRQWCERLSRITGDDLSEEFSFMLKDEK